MKGVHVYVWALVPSTGKVVTAHVNDLTEQSFRDFVMRVMVDNRMVVGVVRDEEVPLFVRDDYVMEAEDVD